MYYSVLILNTCTYEKMTARMQICGVNRKDTRPVCQVLLTYLIHNLNIIIGLYKGIVYINEGCLIHTNHFGPSASVSQKDSAVQVMTNKKTKGFSDYSLRLLFSLSGVFG